MHSEATIGVAMGWLWWGETREAACLGQVGGKGAEGHSGGIPLKMAKHERHYGSING